MRNSQRHLNRFTLAIIVAFTGYSTTTFAGGDYNHGSGHNCTHYEIVSHGGDGAVRFMNNPSRVIRVGYGVKHGKVCGSGNITVELGKRHPGSHLSLRIGGGEYVFGPGDYPDRTINIWHRKYFNIHLPYANYGGGDKYNDYAYHQLKPKKHHYKRHNYHNNGYGSYHKYGHKNRYQNYHHNYHKNHSYLRHYKKYH